MTVKETPIFLKGALAQAAFDGGKTQTRRLVRPQPDIAQAGYIPGDGVCARFTPEDERYGRLGQVIRCPYGGVGDRLWVRETHMREPHPSEVGLTREMIPRTWDAACAAADTIHYAAAPGAWMLADGRRWTPSIHMPRTACRTLLEIVSVRIERLQDISDADLQAEGIMRCEHELVDDGCMGLYAPSELFSMLWSGIYGTNSWLANPWVWVIEFKRVVNG